jgi:hypothetical protein
LQQGPARFELAEFDQHGSAAALESGDLRAKLAGALGPSVEVRTKLRVARDQSDSDQAVEDVHLLFGAKRGSRQFALDGVEHVAPREFIGPNVAAGKLPHDLAV